MSQAAGVSNTAGKAGWLSLQRQLPAGLRQPALSAILTWLTAGSMQADSRTHAALAILQKNATATFVGPALPSK